MKRICHVCKETIAATSKEKLRSNIEVKILMYHNGRVLACRHELDTHKLAAPVEILADWARGALGAMLKEYRL